MLTEPSAPQRMSLHAPPPPAGDRSPLQRFVLPLPFASPRDPPTPCKPPPGSFHRAQAHPPDPSLPLSSSPRRIPMRG